MTREARLSERGAAPPGGSTRGDAAAPPVRAAPAPEGATAWVEALLAAPGGADPLLPLWRPRDRRPSPELAHVPLLLWLMGALRPGAAALAGLGDGVACHALCQAAEHLGLSCAITAHVAPGEAAALGPGYARHAEAAAARHRVVASPGGVEGPGDRREPVDLLCVMAPERAARPDALLWEWQPSLRDDAVVAWFADAAPALAPPERTLALEGGLILACPRGVPPALAPLLAGSEARRRAALLFGRLGRLWIPARDEPRAEALAGIAEAAGRQVDEALGALEERDRALEAARERLAAVEVDHALVRARRDALWEAMREARGAADEAEAARAREAEARSEVEGRLAEAQEALGAERAARAAAEDAAHMERAGRLEAQRRGVEAVSRLDPWLAARAALLGAELAARRARRLGLGDHRARMGQPSTRRQIALIRGSSLFDAEWYRARHPDIVARPRRLALGGRDEAARLAAHYLHHGAAEGRDPGPGFGTRAYYLAHPDVAGAGWNALVHYEVAGRAEGREAAPAGAGPSEASDAALIEASELFDAAWYAAAHPEIPEGMTPAEHYLAVGAAAGHDPGPAFGTTDYLDANPDIGQAGVNPLVHYLRHGREEGRAARPGGPNSPRRRVETLRAQLLSLGFTEAPLRGLEAAALEEDDPEVRERAALELGRWHLRRENGPDPAEALRWLDHAGEAARAALRDESLARIAVMRLACLHALGRDGEARALVEGARGGGRLTPALTLAGSMLEGSEGGRVDRINEAMRAFGLPDVALREARAGATLYDRLRTAGEPAPVNSGPLVSVIVAAYDAEATLPLTLQAMREQSWRRHEVIVVDDASTDGTRAVAERFAREDPRVRVLPLDRNVGAYAARNRALAVARGELVALQDADDWAHATRIEIQARHLAGRADLVACTSQQARLRDDLTLAHFSAQGDLIFTSIASLMFRRVPVTQRLGGWDEVRFSADHEMIRRLQDAFSRSAVENLQTGPVTLQRYSEGSAIADLATGFNGAYSGARLEYFEAQRHHRRRGGPLRYEPGSRPFPVPVIMRPDARRGEPRHYDVVIASELRMMGGSARSCVEEMRAQRAAGLTTGVVKMYRYDLPTAGRVDTLSFARDEIDGDAVTMLTYGERATCDLLIVRYPPVLRHPQRYLPALDPARVKVVVNQPPMSDYGEGGRRRYDLAGAEANLRAAFGRPGEWHPIGPLVREALREHHADELGAIDLRPDDWINLIDVDDWDRGLDGGPRAAPGPLRIGRHARDNPVKWPATAADILTVYPDAPDLEVHVLGGADAPATLLGRVPDNWRVEGFGARPPREFLADIDVFVYYTHPTWVESFGRAIVEAMAAGVPVVLPPAYEAAFGAAAVYAPPEGAVEAARRLHADPGAYRAQALRAQALARGRYGHDLHRARLREAGVRRAAAA